MKYWLTIQAKNKILLQGRNRIRFTFFDKPTSKFRRFRNCRNPCLFICFKILILENNTIIWSLKLLISHIQVKTFLCLYSGTHVDIYKSLLQLYVHMYVE